MSDESEPTLYARFVRGDEGAFEALFRRHQKEVYHWAMRIVRDRGAAEEVTVEAFWRAYRARARFDASRSFGAWMRRIATNAALDHIRRERRRVPLRPLENEAVDTTGEPTDVATLAFVEGLSHQEIAEALEVPVGTVKSRVFRAVSALRKELSKLGVKP